MSVFSMQVVGRLPKAWFNLPQFLCIHEALHFRDQEILQFVQSLLYIYTPIYIYLYINTHMYTHIYMYIYIYVCMCTNIKCSITMLSVFCAKPPYPKPLRSALQTRDESLWPCADCSWQAPLLLLMDWSKKWFGTHIHMENQSNMIWTIFRNWFPWSFSWIVHDFQQFSAIFRVLGGNWGRLKGRLDVVLDRLTLETY
jgi:hypothetical protein